MVADASGKPRFDDRLYKEARGGRAKQPTGGDDLSVEKVFVVPDTHVPFHDRSAWHLALKAMRGWKPDLVIFIGDFGDCYSISDFDKDPERKLSFVDEVDAVNAELDKVQAIVDGNVVFEEGNHEDRGRRKVWRQVPELAGLVSIPRLYKLKERGWKHVPYRDVYKVGCVTYTHDLGRAGVNAARQSLVDFGGNLVIGHTHRGGVVYQGEAKGSSHFSLNVGWLGDVNKINYMHKARALRDWQLGFGTVVHDGPRRAFARFHPIVGSRVEVDGEIYG